MTILPSTSRGVDPPRVPHPPSATVFPSPSRPPSSSSSISSRPHLSPALHQGFRTGGDGGEAGAAARAGGACGGARLEARRLLLQGAHGEEQAVRRAAPHRREVPGALQAALLHPPRKSTRPL